MSSELDADSLTLPIKRTDGETIEERLTGNAYHNILPARYLRKDADGELVEQQEELFERVAKNIALAEAVYEAEKQDIEITVTPEQLKPDHPRRDELAQEVFGKGVSAVADVETRLTEHNVNKFAYETIVPELPETVREHVEETADSFQEQMEQLSFMPNCVPPDSLVAASGGMKQLSAVEPGERVYDDQDGTAAVEETYENGTKQVVEIETSAGYSVRATPEHYFRVITASGEYEWRQVMDIEPDDILTLQKNFLDDEGDRPTLTWQPSETGEQTERSAGRFEPPVEMTDDLAEWLGLSIAEGTARERGVTVPFDSDETELGEHWRDLTESVFGLTPELSEHARTDCLIGRADSPELSSFLEDNELYSENIRTATVPDAVMQSGRSGIERFLSGLFEANGTVDENGIELYTHSTALGEEVQKLLLGLGIRSSTSETAGGYRISIQNDLCRRRFRDRVGFSTEKTAKRADQFIEQDTDASPITVPNQTDRLREWIEQTELGTDTLSEILVETESNRAVGKRQFEAFTEDHPELRESPVAELVERDQFYEPVTEMTEIGTMAVEDMQVPRRNTYVVEGFVSHNSPTLMNAGDELQQLSACFVDSPADDIDDIHQTAKEAAQVFQCLTADTRLHVQGKGTVSIADVEPGDEIVQRDGESHQTQLVEETHAYDESPVYRVETEAGIELRGTPNHELLVDGDWTRIDEIESDDTLSVRLGWLPDTDDTSELIGVGSGGQRERDWTATNETAGERRPEGLSDQKIAPEPDERLMTVQKHSSQQTQEPSGEHVRAVSRPKTLTPELAELLGMWIGNGSKHDDGIRFHIGREENLEHADRLCRQLFDDGLDWNWEEGSSDAVLHSHEINRFWLANFGDTKPETTVPEQIWRADHETIEAFLRGLFTTGGSLHNETYPRLQTASEDLLDGVQQLLLGLGIPAQSWETDSEDPETDSVGPTGEQGLKRFVAHVGFTDERTEKMESTLAETDFRATTVGTICEDNSWQVPVQTVTDDGKATVYDVTVADDPEYVAHSVVSHNSGGGMGYAFWKLRPYGDPVGSTGGIASGPITFMRTYDQMCFPPGTKVLTPDGQRPIETLSEGDLVIDENGAEQPVTETMERQVDEDLVEITPERLNRPIRATGEHPFKVVRDDGFEWVDARDITDEDLLVVGHATDDNGLGLDEHVALSELASGPFVFTDGGVTINQEYYGQTKGSQPASIAGEVPVSALATVAGWYLAEGCVVYRRGVPSEVTFTLNADEQAYANEIETALSEFDVSTRQERVEDRDTLHVHVESATFAKFIEELFGTGAANKDVPDVFWNAPQETQARVLEALFDGNGTVEHREKSQRVQLTLASEAVIDWTFQAGLRCGVQFSRQRQAPEDQTQTYCVSVSVSTALGTPLEGLFDDVGENFRSADRTKQAHGHEVVAVESVDRVAYDGPVYNAEVADTHTYVAEDVVVHNCETIAQGGARRGAQMGVMRVSHPDVIQFIHAKNKDVSLANTLRLNDPDDFTHTSFAEALEEARDLIDDQGRVPEHLRNAVEGHLSNFNISVGITDRFMEAVKNGEEFTFTNPRTDDPHVATEQTKELYEMFDLGEHVEVGEVLSVPAQKIWERIVEGAHENGEPGVIYLERVNKQHSFDVQEHPDHRILATNPCITGDTLISTENGLIEAEKLYEQGVARDVVVDGRLSEDRVKEASSVYKTGQKDVYKLETEEGYELRLTADHRVMTDDGWVTAQNLETGDTVHIQNRKGKFGQHGSAQEGRVLGWMVGDGHFEDGKQRAVLNVNDEDSQISEKLASDLNEVVCDPDGNADYEIGVSEISRGNDYRGTQAVEQRIRSTRLYEYAEKAGLVEEKLQVPDAVMRGSEEMARGFLQALFSADGCVQETVENGISVRLATVDADLLKEVQQLLLNFGIASRIYEERKEPGTTELPDGDGRTKEYETQGFHELVISGAHAVCFREEIGFLLENKSETLAERLSAYSNGPSSPDFEATVEAVEHDGHEAVYDLTEPDTNSFVANGLVVHNCGEQPLEEYEACNLGHINLSTLAARDAPDWRVWSQEHADEYATEADAIAAFLEEAIEFEEFDRRIELGTRFLENVVTMSDFPVDEIEQTVREMRKIGLGIMGLAQLYIQLGIEYGSETANEVARQLMTHINHESKWASHQLANERGSFGEWDNSKYANPTEYREWFEHHTGEDAEDWEDGFPIRNHNTTTIAPTGTTSMVGNTTGGCEPIYNVAYYKNVSDDVQGDEMLVEFDDYFLRTLEANDIDVEAVKREAQEQMAENEFEGVDGLTTVPDAIGELFVTTGDLSAKEHAGVQTACQEGVDSAISKTVNAPNDSTVEDAKEVFEYIYDHGGKGVTYYRDGTRSKQVLTTRAQNTEFAGMDETEVIEQIEELFGSLDAFIESDEVQNALDKQIEDLLDVIDSESGAYTQKRPRPDVLHGVTQRIDTGYGKLYVNINEDPEADRPFELFANIGNSGGFTASFTEALAKTISTALRAGVDPEEIAEELKGIRSPKVAWDKGEQIQSIPDAIGTAMQRYLEGDVERAYPQQQTLEETAESNRSEMEHETDGGAVTQTDKATGDQQTIIEAGENPECPSCGSLSLYYSEGCKTCESCGWSEC